MPRPEYGAFRPGLPSVEDVRAHEERGGWWLAFQDGDLDLVEFRASPSSVVEIRPGVTWYSAPGMAWGDWSFRPVDADGYALPWPDEEAPDADR